jgi:hypothetical protein
MTENDIHGGFNPAVRRVRIGRGAIRRFREHEIKRDVQAEIEESASGNRALEHLLKNPVERQRIHDDVRSRLTTARQHALQVALFGVTESGRFIQDTRRWVEDTRRDTSLSFKGALNGITPDGMLTLELLKERRRTAVLTMTADELLVTYEQAMTSKEGAISYINAALIENLMHEGTGLALDADDLPKLKRLRAYIAGIQDLRVPDLPDYESLADDIASLYQRADVLQVGPVNPELYPDAAAAYRDQEDILLEAGTPSDREDLQAVHELTGMRGA